MKNNKVVIESLRTLGIDNPTLIGNNFLFKFHAKELKKINQSELSEPKKIKERIKLDKARLLLEEFSNLDIKIILEEEISEKIENNLINGKTLKIDLFSKNWREQNKVITKMPFSVGVELDDVLGMKFLVRRNEYLPITKKLVIILPEDCDNCVIPILRGESVIASDNRKLGELTLNGIKQQPGHLLKGEVIFQITDDGLLFATFRKRQSMRGRVANTFKILSEFISPE